MSDMYSWQQVAKVMREFFGMGDMAEEILRLRDENAAQRAENAALTAERDRLAAAVERVRTLHVGERRHNGWIDVTCCRECSDDNNTYRYPCSTLHALEVGCE